MRDAHTRINKIFPLIYNFLSKVNSELHNIRRIQIFLDQTFSFWFKMNIGKSIWLSIIHI